MKDHPIACVFPLLPEEEIAELAADIKANGLRHPIVTYDGMILDGRNRYRACSIAGVEPKFDAYTGNDAVEYVVSVNVKRRHLTASQKACVARKLLPFVAEQARKRMLAGKAADPMEPVPQGAARDQAAAMVGGVSGRYVDDARYVEENAPDLYEKVWHGDIPLKKAKKEILAEKDKAAFEEAQKTITASARKKLAEVCEIRHCSARELLTSGIKPDCIITDPPYPKEFLPLYGELAELAATVPLVAVMCGHTWLPEILTGMCGHLTYRWILAYLTPGGTYRSWDRKIDSSWKPVLLFGNGNDYIYDVFRSEARDKRFHEWGQSESGMADLVSRLSKPGQLVCDPFLGAGTTALVSLRLGRRFVGCDTDEEAIKSAMTRLEVEYAKP